MQQIIEIKDNEYIVLGKIDGLYNTAYWTGFKTAGIDAW
jgi:hypothetical protein